ncbi:MAG: hypothetical protein SGI90_10425, partial [Candidatus Eisenbacteria bacterium]|nr:hypothetical protein [Candidatus Eisenbacteria bacterium]
MSRPSSLQPGLPRLMVIGALLFVTSVSVLAGPAALPTSPLTWLRGAAAFLLLGWFPGWVLGTLLGRNDAAGPADPSHRGWMEVELFYLIGLPLALSPILSTGLIVLGSLTGLPVQKSAWLPVMVTAVLLLAAVLLTRHRSAGAIALVPPTAPPGAPTTARPAARDHDIALFSFLVVLLLLAINLANPWLGWRADGRFHIGVTTEILRGGLPPTDPFFAGLNLQYMWFFHAWLAGLSTLSGVSTSWLMIGTNMLGLLAFLTLAATLARELGRSRAGTWLTVLVVGFGMGGLSWALLPIKLLSVFTGEKRGMEELHTLRRLWPPTIQQEMGFLSAGYDQPFLLRKFLVGTAMSLALAAILLQVVLIRRQLKGGGARWLPVLAIASTGAIILHPMVGIPVVAVGLGAALLAPLMARLLPPWSAPAAGG